MIDESQTIVAKAEERVVTETKVDSTTELIESTENKTLSHLLKEEKKVLFNDL